MKRLVYISLTVIVVVGAFVAGTAWNHRAAVPSTQQQRVLYYTCPMHPQYHSDRAGDCPSCGMRLEPVYADPAGKPAAGSGVPLPAGAVQVSPDRQQAIGVHLGVAERVSGIRTLRTTGRVLPKENATYQIVAGASGWIRNIGVPTAGMQVRKNEMLAEFYSPELVPALQAYFALLDSADQVTTLTQPLNQGVAANLQRSGDALRNMGVSDVQLDEMKRKRDIRQDIQILSPVDGFVLQRNVSPGLRFDRGFEFYQIADLSKVWILADIYESQLPFIHSGTKARVATAQQNRQYQTTVSTAQPTFDETTRTLKVRLEADNPGSALKPGMFVDVEFAIDLPATLAVPADAIVDTGLRKTVFVDRGNGYFEPRQVETGWRIADQVEVTKGLMPGERIVISGTFLIDSESRMRAAAMGIVSVAAKDPVCGMEVDQKKAEAAGRKVEYKGQAYYFCSDGCKKRFDSDPVKYAGK